MKYLWGWVVGASGVGGWRVTGGWDGGRGGVLPGVPLTPAGWAYGRPLRCSGPDAAAAVGSVSTPGWPV